MVDLLSLLDEELTEDNIKVIVNHVYEITVTQDSSLDQKTRTVKEAKSLREVYDLIKQVVDDLQRRANTPENYKVTVTEEEPDTKAVTEIITWSLVDRQPGAFGQGAPLEAKVRNQRPVLREEIDDPNNPGYKLGTLGYWHDNIIRLTCWAQTNKAANARAEWLEKLLDEYSWFFKVQGVDRFLFLRRHSDIMKTIENNKWYGRPIDYFVRTETLRVFSEKTIEQILIDVSVKIETRT